jgi:hypothetical protein
VWRVWLLACAVALGPQATLVHALSHAAPTAAPGKERHAGSDKVCDSCLALAQLGAALPSRFEWSVLADPVPQRPLPAAIAPALRHAIAFRARAPPALRST